MPSLSAIVCGLFVRGFVIVGLQAASVVAVSRLWPASAFVVSFAISWSWWQNTNAAAIHRDVPGARIAYALGAGVASLAVVLVTGWLGH